MHGMYLEHAILRSDTTFLFILYRSISVRLSLVNPSFFPLYNLFNFPSAIISSLKGTSANKFSAPSPPEVRLRGSQWGGGAC